MKKKSVKLLLCSAMLALALAVTACGGKKEDKEEAAPTEEVKEEEPAEEPTEEPAEAPTEAPAEEEAPAEDEANDAGRIDASEEEETIQGKFATVKEFAESDMVQEQLKGLKSSLADSGMDINITGEDNKLIYTYTYADLENMDGLAESLEEAMTAQESTFKTVAASIRGAVEVDDPVVVVTYLDANGEEIYSVEFTAD